MIKVGIIDKHPLIRMGLSHLLSRDPQINIIGEFDKPSSLLRSITSGLDVVILDLPVDQLKAIDFKEELSRIRNTFPNSKLVVLYEGDAPLFGVQTLKIKISALLNKSTDVQNLLNVVNIIHRGDFYYDSGLSTVLSELFS